MYLTLNRVNWPWSSMLLIVRALIPALGLDERSGLSGGVLMGATGRFAAAAGCAVAHVLGGVRHLRSGGAPRRTPDHLVRARAHEACHCAACLAACACSACVRIPSSLNLTAQRQPGSISQVQMS